MERAERMSKSPRPPKSSKSPSTARSPRLPRSQLSSSAAASSSSSSSSAFTGRVTKSPRPSSSTTTGKKSPRLRQGSSPRAADVSSEYVAYRSRHGPTPGDLDGEDGSSSSYSQFIAKLHPSLRQLFNDDGSIHAENISSVDDFNKLEYAARIFDELGNNGSEEYAVRLEGLESQVASSLCHKMQEEEEQTEVAGIKLQVFVAELTTSLGICRQARKQVAVAADYAAQNGDHVLMVEKRRRFVQELLHKMQLIDTLRRLEQRATQALHDGHLSVTHAMCKNYDTVMTSELFSPAALVCMKETTERMADAAVESLRRLHGSLQPLCLKFNGEAFEKVLVAYHDLKAGQELLVRLVIEYREALSRAPQESRPVQTARRSRTGRSNSVQEEEPPGEKIIRTLASLADVLLSFHAMVAFQATEESATDSAELRQFKLLFGDGLNVHRDELWTLAQSRVEAVIGTGKERISSLKPTSFVDPYAAASSFAKLGEAFLHSGREGEPAQEGGRRRPRFLSQLDELAEETFWTMHKQNVDIIAIMLRNETWQRAQVSRQDLSSVQGRASVKPRPEEPYKRVQKALEQGVNPIRRMFDGADPTEATKTSPEGAMESLEDGEVAGSNTYTPTSLAVLRWLGRYTQIGRTLPPTAASAAEAVEELFLLYLHHIAEMCTRRRQSSKPGKPLVLEHFLHREDATRLAQLRGKYGHLGGQQDSYTKPEPLSLLSLCVGIESMWTLSAGVEPLALELNKQLPPAAKQPKKKTGDPFHGALGLSGPIRKAAYVLFSVDLAEGISAAVSTASYDLPDKDQETVLGSPFVGEVDKRVSATMSLPLLPASAEMLSEEICRAVMRSYLDGIATVDRCSPTGRALMLVDLRNLEQVLDKHTGLHPVPESEKVQAYIKAYYLNEAELVKWVSANARKYRLTLKQAASLGEVGPGRYLTAKDKYSLRERLVQECLRQASRRKAAGAQPPPNVVFSDEDSAGGRSGASTPQTSSNPVTPTPAFLAERARTPSQTSRLAPVVPKSSELKAAVPPQANAAAEGSSVATTTTRPPPSTTDLLPSDEGEPTGAETTTPSRDGEDPVAVPAMVGPDAVTASGTAAIDAEPVDVVPESSSDGGGAEDDLPAGGGGAVPDPICGAKPSPELSVATGTSAAGTEEDEDPPEGDAAGGGGGGGDDEEAITESALAEAFAGEGVEESEGDGDDGDAAPKAMDADVERTAAAAPSTTSGGGAEEAEKAAAASSTTAARADVGMSPDASSAAVPFPPLVDGDRATPTERADMETGASAASTVPPPSVTQEEDAKETVPPDPPPAPSSKSGALPQESTLPSSSTHDDVARSVERLPIADNGSSELPFKTEGDDDDDGDMGPHGTLGGSEGEGTELAETVPDESRTTLEPDPPGTSTELDASTPTRSKEDPPPGPSGG